MKFCNGGMLAATRVKMSDSEKRVKKNTTFPPQNVELGSFWKFLETVVQNNGKEMYKKKCAARAKLPFC